MVYSPAVEHRGLDESVIRSIPIFQTSISATTRFAFDQTMAPSSSPQDPNPYTDNFLGRDEDFVVIELGEPNNADQSFLGVQERLNSGELSGRSISPSPRKLEQKIVQKKAKKFNHISSMGDECIDIRERDDQFAIQPIRRSFSMDSAADRQLYLAIQEILQQNNRQGSEVSSGEACSSRVRRSFFSFGHERGSRSAVLPIHLEP
ncbi:hypothetical protein F0562_035372 [Nyssa sinensis]|uniref:RING-type E3 ubiquitin transferase n=1 Tax=Nyssa sinensis TaxID=561372 RepID=A0A5J5ABT8_9ASTE|nr:hypothetical protein F0562_035372 [Nyssa sinensis]